MMPATLTISQSGSEEELFRQCGGKQEKNGETSTDLNYKLNNKNEDNDNDISGTKKRKKKSGKDDDAPVLPTGNEDSEDSDDEEDSNYIGCIVLYIIVGYITGIIAVLFFYYWTYQKYISDLNFQWFSIVLLVLLLLIFCRTANCRCSLALVLPTIGGYKGRLLLVAYTFYLTMAGPGINMVQNIEITMHSLSCGQSLLKSSLMPMHQIMGEPVYAVEQSVYVCLAQVRKLMEHLDETFQRIETPIVRIHSSYSSCAEWLQHQQLFFDNQMGAPYDRCLAAGRRSIQECQFKFPDKKELCDIGQKFEWFCAKLKDLPSFFDPHINQQQQQIDEQLFLAPMRGFAKIRSIFEVSITFDHTQKTDEDRPGINLDVDLQIGQQFENQLNILNFLFYFLHVIIVMLVIYFILEIIYFKFNYFGSVEFRNRFITKELNDYNARQFKQLGIDLFPLRTTEEKRFIPMNSWHVLPFETRIRFHSWFFMIISTLQIFTICFVDYSLFWMLDMMNYHSDQTAELQPSEYIKIVVKDGGMIGFIIAGLVKAFEPLSKNLFIDIQNCLPIPRPPKYADYWKIGILIFMNWMFTIFGPYISRQQNRIMDIFYPKLAKQRAEHLHNLIMHDREIFITAARQRARAVNMYVYENATLKKWYLKFAKAWNWITCNRCGLYEKCLICLKGLKPKESVICDTPDCRGMYCQTCFIESNCLCVLCSDSRDYGDFDYFSEVADSSDMEDHDEEPYRQGRQFYPQPPPKHGNERQKNA